MHNITKTLLGSAALCALTTVPAVAVTAPGFHFQALHSGHVVNKTKIHIPGSQHLTYTFDVYTTIPAQLDKKVRILGERVCGSTSVKIKVAPKKGNYGKFGTYTETYSTGCVALGDTYKLTNPNGEGGTEHFVSSVSSKFEQNGLKYKGTVNLDVTATIE